MSERYPEHILLRSQWDDVFKVIEEAGFKPSAFARATAYGREYNGMVPNLIHKPTGSEFVFDFDREDGEHFVEYSPGAQQPRDRDRGGSEGFGYILWVVRVWLANIKREQASPDLWALLDEQRDALAASTPTGETENTPFSPEEQVQIRAQLNEIKELLVNNHGADPVALETRIEQLEEASKRMGRREWLLMFMGAGLDWTLHGLFPPEGLREMLSLAAQGIGHLFGGVPQLPMP